MKKEKIEEIFEKYLKNNITECIVRTGPTSGSYCSVEKTTIEKGRMVTDDEIEDMLIIDGIPKRGFFPIREIISIDAVVPFERVRTSE